MCIEKQQNGQFLVVTFTEKRLSAALASQFEQRMKELIEAGHQHLILDLAKVDFIDSSGLGAIVASFKLLGNKGDFILCGVHGAVASLLNLTRMDRIFPVYKHLDDAISEHR